MTNLFERWYGIPDNHLPDENYCVLVQIPKDTSYLAAFMGSWKYLTTWLAWEKDELKRAREVAKRWKQNEPMVVCCDILDALDEDGCMAINIDVNCNCGGGCGGGDTHQTIVNGDLTVCLDPYEDILSDDALPQEWAEPIDPEGELPDFGSDGPATWEEFDARMCDVAHELTQLLGRAFTTLDGGIDSLVNAVQVLQWLSFVGLGKVLAEKGAKHVIKLITRLAQWEALAIADNFLSEIGDEIQDTESQLNQDIVCAIYTNRHNLVGAKSAMVQRLHDWVIEELFTQDVADWVAGLVGEIWPLDVILELGYLGNALVPIPQNESDCSECGSAYGDYVEYQWPNSLAPWEHTPYQYDGWGEDEPGDGYAFFAQGAWGNITAWVTINQLVSDAGLSSPAGLRITRIEILGVNCWYDTYTNQALRVTIDGEGVGDGPSSHDWGLDEIPIYTEGWNDVMGWNCDVSLPVPSNNRAVTLHGQNIGDGSEIYVDGIRIYYEVTE